MSDTIAIGGEYIDYGPNWLYDYCNSVINVISGSLVLTESSSLQYVLTDVDDTFVFLESYTPNINNSLNPYFLLPYYVQAVKNYPTASSYSLALEQHWPDSVYIEEGVKVNSNILFNPITEQQNVDESYKRVVYNQYKNLYYPDIKDPTKMLGLDNLDILLDNKNRVLYDKIKVATIPQLFYGDRIVENSVIINEDTGIVSYTITDDGMGNLKASSSMFSFYVDDVNKKVPSSNSTIINRNKGYSVSINDRFSLIGNPCFELFGTSGSVDVYIYNSQLSNKFFYDESLVRQTFNTSGTAPRIVLNSDFGRSVDLIENVAAVSSIYAQYIYPSGSNVLYTDSSIIEIYNLNNSYTSPVYAISSSIIPSSYQTGSGTFGWAISINDQFLAIGCPHTYQIGSISSSYNGCVYMLSGSINTGYTFHSQLTGSNIPNDVLFGKCLKLDKNYNKLVVGNGDDTIGSGSVYLFELSGSKWVQTQKFNPTKQVDNLNFLPVLPSNTFLNTVDGFGTAVSIYCSSSTDIKIAVGAPFDRTVYQFTGSGCYKNGAVYIYENKNCTLQSGSTIVSSSFFFNQSRISGDYDAFLQNKFGSSVDIWGNNLIVSCPKYFSEYTTDYVYNTFLEPFNFDDLEETQNVGMFYVYQEDNIGNWNTYVKYKTNKIYGQPYNFYGYSLSLYDDNIITGNPVVVVDNNNTVPTNFYPDEIQYLKNLCGNFNIFNLTDYDQTHYIGNVFYQTGKIITSTSGSIFDHIFKSPVNIYPKYEITFNNSLKRYQKEIICTANPGEFNYSTNPTSYTYEPYSDFDLDHNGVFNFDDCDKLLRLINYKFTGNEAWWQYFNYTDMYGNFVSPSAFYTTDDSVSFSLFKMYLNNILPVSTKFTSPAAINDLIEEYDSLLDINDDGIADYLDMNLLWKYFTNVLTINNYEAYQTSQTLISSRNTYDLIYSYLSQETGNGKPGTILPYFYDIPISASITNISASYLVPYITTIGLYNGADLVAVAKLGTPIKNQGVFPLNFLIRFDV